MNVDKSSEKKYYSIVYYEPALKFDEPNNKTSRAVEKKNKNI